MNTTKSTSSPVPSIPTVTMPGMGSPLIRFLAKVQKGAVLGSLNSPPAVSVLRYGNRAQAEAKRKTLPSRILQEEHSSAVVQVESRFVIAIFPAEYDLDQKSGKLIAKSLCDARIGSPSGKRCNRPAVPGTGFCAAHTGGKKKGAVEVYRRPPFATVSGPRFNPRNRHNQHLPDEGPRPGILPAAQAGFFRFLFCQTRSRSQAAIPCGF